MATTPPREECGKPGLEYPNNIFVPSSIHEHAFLPLPKERKGVKAAVNRLLDGSLMWCGQCKSLAVKHNKVLTCDFCSFVLCGKCSKVRLPIVVVKPGEDKSLPFANRVDEERDGKCVGLAKTHKGEIVFSKTKISKFEEQENVVCNQFNLGDEIHARAYWPRALSNYPIGKSPDGRGGYYPVYGPDHCLRALKEGHRHNVNFYLYLTINRNEYPKDGSPWWTFTYEAITVQKDILEHQQKYENISEWPINFYSYVQSMPWLVFSATESDDEDFGPAAIRFGQTVALLSAGNHLIQFQLCYQLVPAIDNHGEFPPIATPISAPISTGEFQLFIPSEQAKEDFKSVISDFPKRGPLVMMSDESATLIEEKILKLFRESADWGSRPHRKEECLHISLQTDWYLFETSEDAKLPPALKPPPKYAVDFAAVFLRKKSDGWEKDAVVKFQLSAVNNAKNVNEPAFGDIDNDSKSTEIDPNFIPDEIKKRLSL